MTDDLMLFLRDAVGHEPLMRAAERLTGLACWSDDVPNDAAPAYCNFVDYSEGLLTGFSMSWPPETGVEISTSELAHGLAEEFRTDVLFEAEDVVSETGEQSWRLASPGQSEAPRVKVRELKDS